MAMDVLDMWASRLEHCHNIKFQHYTDSGFKTDRDMQLFSYICNPLISSLTRLFDNVLLEYQQSIC